MGQAAFATRRVYSPAQPSSVTGHRDRERSSCSTTDNRQQLSPYTETSEMICDASGILTKGYFVHISRLPLTGWEKFSLGEER